MQHDSSPQSALARSDAPPSPKTPIATPPSPKITAPDVSGYFEKSDDYKHFKEWVPVKNIDTVRPNAKQWNYFQYGTRTMVPLVFLHGLSGTADCFYLQILSLSVKGYHVISVNIPPCFSHDEFLIAFDDFLTGIQQTKVHLLGVGLGGFLAQIFAEYKPEKIASLILSNTFSDTEQFHKNAPCVEMFAVMPGFVLKKLILNAFPHTPQEIMIIRSMDFMIDKLESLSQKQIASRMTLNCSPRYVKKLPIPDEKITIIDCMDDIIYTPSMRDNVYKLFPNARLALLKTGGDFPYLSREAEFTMYLQVHLRMVGNQNLPVLPKEVQLDPYASDILLSVNANIEPKAIQENNAPDIFLPENSALQLDEHVQRDSAIISEPIAEAKPSDPIHEEEEDDGPL